MERVEVAVVGAGMAGLSAAYHLRHLGRRLLVVEADRIGNREGSSTGASRMYREMYSDPYLCAMSQAANARWRALEARHDVSLRREHGLLFYGEAFDEETIEGSIPGAKRVMDAQGIPYEELDAARIAARFPLRPRPTDVGLFEPTAGAVLSDRVLRLFAEEVRRGGARIREGLHVDELDLGGGRPRLRTVDGTIEAEQVILCGGPWTNALLGPLGLDLELEVWAMLFAHYEVADAGLQHPQWFCFRRPEPATRDGGLYYGFPAMDRHPDGRRRIKVGIDWAPEEMRAASWHALPREPANHAVKHLDRVVREQLDGVGALLEVRTSPYTMAADVNFVLDRLHPRLVCFTGGSGQAFKFCPLIGELLAKLALREDPEMDIGPWGAERLRRSRAHAAAR
ncbi:MAG: FAD-dependent oxidoreductase [Sandaracinaceae bacterium]